MCVLYVHLKGQKTNDICPEFHLDLSRLLSAAISQRSLLLLPALIWLCCVLWSLDWIDIRIYSKETSPICSPSLSFALVSQHKIKRVNISSHKSEFFFEILPSNKWKKKCKNPENVESKRFDDEIPSEHFKIKGHRKSSYWIINSSMLVTRTIHYLHDRCWWESFVEFVYCPYGVFTCSAPRPPPNRLSLDF